MTDMSNIQYAVEEALDTIRPYLIADGGNITLVEITADMKVKVKLTGACNKCPMSQQTLQNGVEVVIKKAVPEITEVIAIN